MRTRSRLILPLVFLMTCAFGQKPEETFEKTVKPYLTKNCLACHNPSLKTAQLDLAPLREVKAAMAERDVWENVIAKLKSGQMPPAASPKPEPEATAQVTAWMEAHVERYDRGRKVDPGRVTARRLNRAEYNNTIRDLLGVSFRPADDFPVDDSGYGFDNIGDVLSLSPSLMEKYLRAAEQIVKLALRTGGVVKPMVDRYDLERSAQAQLPADPEGQYLSRRGAVLARHLFPVDGEYELRVNLRGRGAVDSPPAPLVILAGGRQVQTVEVESGQNRKRNWEVRVSLKAGESPVGAAFVMPGPKRPEDPDQTMQVDSIEVRGPYVTAETGLPESHRRVFVCTPPAGSFDQECGRKILSRFARQAWRRPATAGEIDALMRFVRMAEEEKDSFEKGIELAVKAVLVSPNFLFRIERDANPNDATAAHALSANELASRLSYFLWSSMPDEELLALAEQKKLAEPVVLEKQVKRMLADGKASAFAENFAGQWLELRNLTEARPDATKFPGFDPDLREAMRRETTLFFNAVLQEDRSILDFIDGKFTYLNERLAKHYGIEGVEGRKFRRVELDGVKRSGVLTQASVMTVTSYPTRTSPVLRGLWVLENFLGTPPPAPPANVPQLVEKEIGKTASLRQQMERHRADPACAVCHNKMDALGFGLENYDAVGMWRDKDGNFDVDAAGVLPGNKSFSTPAGMKAILMQEREAFTHMLSEKMLTYALGRGPESYDKPVIRSIGKTVASSEYRISSMILGIVNSPPFQMRRGDAGRTSLAGKR